jgi:uncharacterized protein
MIKNPKGAGILFSPKDLNVFHGSRVASWLDRAALEGKTPTGAKRNVPTQHERVLRANGFRWEAEVQKALTKRYAQAAIFSQIEGDFAKALGPAIERTLSAMRDGAPLIFQGALQASGLFGFPDFLLRVEKPSELGRYSYEPYDAKSSASVKPPHAIQLCAVAEMLEQIQGVRPESFGFYLRTDRKRVSAPAMLRTEDYYYYYLALKQRLFEFHSRLDLSQAPPRPEPGEDHGHWSDFVNRLLEDQLDLSLVAGITTSQIKKLRKIGVENLRQLATSEIRPKGISPASLDTLKCQAALQLESQEAATPKYVLRKGSLERDLGLTQLPAADPETGDVVIDMESHSLSEDGEHVYLWGVAFLQDGTWRYQPRWAVKSGDQGTNTLRLLQWLLARKIKHPRMHIYHYGDADKAALQRLVMRFDVGAAELGALLRAQAFVDLFRVVRQGLVVGGRSYGLKDIERLIPPGPARPSKRTGPLTEGGESVAQFDRWLSAPDSRDPRRSKTLRLIRDYNEQDCRSTWDLAIFLRSVQRELDVTPTRVATAAEPSKKDALSSLPRSRRPDPAKLRESDRIQLLTQDLEQFFQRERRATWWSYFEKLGLGDEEAFDHLEVLHAVRPTSTANVYSYDPAQPFKLKEGDCCIPLSVARTKDFPNPWVDPILIEAIDRAGGLITLKPKKPGATEMPAATDTLIGIDKAMSRMGQDLRDRFAEILANPSSRRAVLGKLLGRRPPKCLSAAFAMPAWEDRKDKLLPLLLKMKSEVLAIQGPPGCGKTSLGGQLVAGLLAMGKRVAITSNSHRAIDLLLERALDEAIASETRFAAVKLKWDAKTGTTRLGRHLLEITPAKLYQRREGPVVVGATCLDLAKRPFAAEFDYLFVDEASQVSLSYLVAVHGVATNIVLLGDQMQLGQPLRATHPGESGLSALEYYSASCPTLTPPKGLFLPDSFRLTPEISRFVSDLYYQSRLRSHPIAAQRKLSGIPGLEASRGVVHLPATHEGNRQSSPEEVELIVKAIENLLRNGRFTDADGSERGLRIEDILVVAPYNHQVHLLKGALLKAGYPGARVGTVDLFQGQQAPVVIVSICNSADQEADRGTEFLLDPRRMNVALSRAQVLSIVVGHPELAFKRTRSLRELRVINGYAKIVLAGGAGIWQSNRAQAA